MKDHPQTSTPAESGAANDAARAKEMVIEELLMKDAAGDPLDARRAEFALAEYQLVHQEIDGILKGQRTMEHYAVLAIGVVWAWQLTPPEKSQVGWYIPLAISLLTAIRTLGTYGRLRASQTYLRITERRFGLKGWETFLDSQPSWMVWSSVVIWVVILGFTIAPLVPGLIRIPK